MITAQVHREARLSRLGGHFKNLDAGRVGVEAKRGLSGFAQVRAQPIGGRAKSDVGLPEQRDDVGRAVFAWSRFGYAGEMGSGNAAGREVEAINSPRRIKSRLCL